MYSTVWSHASVDVYHLDDIDGFMVLLPISLVQSHSLPRSDIRVRLSLNASKKAACSLN